MLGLIVYLPFILLIASALGLRRSNNRLKHYQATNAESWQIEQTERGKDIQVALLVVSGFISVLVVFLVLIKH